MVSRPDLIFCPTTMLEKGGDMIVGWKEDKHTCIYDRCDEETFEDLMKEWKKVEISRTSPLIKLGTISGSHSSHRSLLDSIKWSITGKSVDYSLILYPRDLTPSDFPHAEQINNALTLCSRANCKTKSRNDETLVSPTLTAASKFVFDRLMKLSSAWLNQDHRVGTFLCDILLGILFGCLIFRYSTDISDALCSVYKRQNEILLPKAIQWLMGYPAGLKLNSNLSRFIGELYLWLLGLWVELFRLHIEPHLATLLQVVGVSGALGFRVLSASSCLLLRVLLLNFELYYMLAARLFSAESIILGSLWRLFRGKKWNVLHSRLDSADYSLDQLLLGTVIFTTMMFLLPTVLVYYILFAGAEITRIVVLTLLNACLVLMDLPSLSQSLPGPTVALEIVTVDPPIFLIREKGSTLTGFITSVSKSWHAVVSYHFGPSFVKRVLTGGNRVNHNKSQ